MVQQNNAAAPFLRWAGSKRKLIPELLQFWDGTHTRYVEPFMGSACLYFALSPKEAVLSDINKDLVSTFKQVKADPEAVFHSYRNFGRSRDAYYRVRALNPKKLTPTKRAARFIYLNRFCFNGLYRTNLDGEFNVPYGGTRNGQLPKLDELKSSAKILRSARIQHSDFAAVITKNVEKGDLVYLDPPYAVQNRRVFKQYGPAVFGQKDLKSLSDCLLLIHAREAHFVLSYANSPEGRKLFGNWNHKRLTVTRNIAGFAKHRKEDKELIITNKPL